MDSRTAPILWTVKPLPSAVVSKLDLAGAIDAERDAPHAWLPEEPAWRALGANQAAVAATIASQLATGYAPRTERVVNMRKTSFAIRPLAVWWPLDRIVYRALTERIVADVDPLDQSGKAYMTFVNGPVKRATAPVPGPGGTQVVKLQIEGYVVKADITSFYQYVDHRILAEQLLLLSNDYEAIDALIELLGQTQGRAFGLPQMLQPSDRLADIYIQAVARSLLRAGRTLWRYNDDFRIACDTYIDSLSAIEDLAVAARRVGLVMNESKTAIIKIEKYINGDTPFSVDDDIVTGDTGGLLAEELAGDYDELMTNDDDSTDAVAIIEAIAEPGTVTTEPDAELAAPDPFAPVARQPIGVDNATTAEIRTVRAALRKLTRLADPAAIGKAAMLVGYIANLTPAVMRYVSAQPAATPGVAQALDDIATSSLNNWQRIWMSDALLTRHRLGDTLTPTQSNWVAGAARDGSDPLARAHAAATAAVTGQVEIKDVREWMNTAPDVAAQWYVSALDDVITDKSQRDAYGRSEQLYKWMLTYSPVPAQSGGAGAQSTSGGPSATGGQAAPGQEPGTPPTSMPGGQ